MSRAPQNSPDAVIQELLFSEEDVADIERVVCSEHLRDMYREEDVPVCITEFLMEAILERRPDAKMMFLQFKVSPEETAGYSFKIVDAHWIEVAGVKIGYRGVFEGDVQKEMSDLFFPGESGRVVEGPFDITETRDTGPRYEREMPSIRPIFNRALARAEARALAKETPMTPSQKSSPRL